MSENVNQLIPEVPVINQPEEVDSSEDENFLKEREYLNQLGDIGTVLSPLYPENKTVRARVESFFYFPRGEIIN